jgi:type 2 lantibiotic biosynthesis protein LanM
VTDTWIRALGVRERRGAGAVPVNTELAERRLQRWQSQPPFTDPTLFGQRLAADGLSIGEFAAILGEPSDDLARRLGSPGEWAERLATTLDHPHPELAQVYPDQLAILSAVQPLVLEAREEVLSAVSALPDGPFTREAMVDQLAALVPPRLFNMLARSVLVELQRASQAGALPGATPRDRFASFVDYLVDGGGLDLLQAYPVLGRHIRLSLDHWAAFSTEFLARLTSDIDAIRGAFDVGEAEVLRVEGGLSDPHHNGREVLIVTFTSGVRVVYKPKRLAVDAHFQELLGWLNARGQQPALRTVRVLDRGDYGWVEFVAARSCDSLADVGRFYERQGALLALLHAVSATDLHYENIVAAGPDPVLVDLEALFHPSLRGADDGGAFERALGRMDESVLAVGMLPQPMRLAPGTPGLDVSALGGGGIGQLSPRGVPRWVGGASDEARIVYKRVPLSAGHHRSMLNGVPTDVLSFSESLLAGFTRTYRLIVEHRVEILDSDGPLSWFADDTVRLLLRPTVVYARLLQESLHPDLLRDGLERDRFLDRLWVAVPNQPRLVGAIAAEQHDLWQGDIPKFTCTPATDALRTSTGELVPGVIVEPGLSVVRRRLANLDEADLKRQTWFIHAALGSLPGVSEPGPRPTGRLTQARIASCDELIDAARGVGRRLLDLALVGRHDSTWIGTSSAGGGLSVAPLGADLYDGLPGVALFLAQLGVVTGQSDFQDVARMAVSGLQRQIADGLTPISTIGAFSGWGGLVYGYARLADLLEDPALLRAAETIVVEQLPSLVDPDDQLDVAGGAAGCIGALLALGSDAALAQARRCGERLLSTASVMDTGIGWKTPAGNGVPLTGFAHGAAGFAWALARLAAATGEERFRVAAGAALAYERSLLSHTACNWPDLRSGAGDRFMLAWCHGAPGIGMGRLATLATGLCDADLATDIDHALSALRSHALGASDALCHGELGNLELLELAAHCQGRDEYHVLACTRAAAVLDGYRRTSQWRCAAPFGLQTPGLMTGISGIGYALLKLAQPESVPSVLTLQRRETSFQGRPLDPCGPNAPANWCGA